MKGNLTLALFLATLVGNAQSPAPTIQKTFHIASAGGWDYLAVSPVADWLYVSHGTQVNILNKNTGDSVGVIKGTIGVHGIAFAPALGKGFTSNGRLNNVFVFDLKTNEVTDSIKTGGNPDAIFYESYSKKIITCNGNSKDASVIEPATNKVVATISLSGKPETAVSDGKGKMFIDIEDKNEVVEVDLKTMKVTRHFNIGDAEEPAGLAFDPKTKRLFVGCGNKKLVVMSTNGKIIQTLPIGDHCDGTAFDDGAAYASCGDGTLSRIRLSGSQKAAYSVDNFNTQKGARTIAADPVTHLIYLPTADYEKQAPGAKGRPSMIPGTFRVLVIGK